MTFQKNEVVLIQCDGRRVQGHIVMASGNGKSLMLGFDAMIDGHVGQMPVLQNDDGEYEALVTGTPVKLIRVEK
jgi:hypothetical protein